jgi:hypothetical protein
LWFKLKLCNFDHNSFYVFAIIVEQKHQSFMKTSFSELWMKFVVETKRQKKFIHFFSWKWRKFIITWKMKQSKMFEILWLFSLLSTCDFIWWKIICRKILHVFSSLQDLFSSNLTRKIHSNGGLMVYVHFGMFHFHCTRVMGLDIDV